MKLKVSIYRYIEFFYDPSSDNRNELNTIFKKLDFYISMIVPIKHFLVTPGMERVK